MSDSEEDTAEVCERSTHCSLDNLESLEFQIVDWFIPKRYHKDIDDNNDTDGTYDNKINDNYDIYMYGVTEDSKSVMCIVKGFEPFFYVRCPTYMSMSEVKKFKKSLEFKLRDGDFTYKAFDKTMKGLYPSQCKYLSKILVRRWMIFGVIRIRRGYF